MTKEQVIDFYEHLRKDDTIINFDSQGWPNHKMDLRTILESVGFGTYDVNGETVFGIKSDAEVLRAFPTTLEDDGMGYGVNEKFVVFSSNNEETDDEVYCHFFVEPELENKDMWYDNCILPGTEIEYEGHHILLMRANDFMGQRWFEGRIYSEGSIPTSINVPETYVKEYVSKNLFENE